MTGKHSAPWFRTFVKGTETPRNQVRARLGSDARLEGCPATNATVHVSPVFRKVRTSRAYHKLRTAYGPCKLPELKTMPKSMSFTVCGTVDLEPAMTNLGVDSRSSGFILQAKATRAFTQRIGKHCWNVRTNRTANS